MSPKTAEEINEKMNKLKVVEREPVRNGTFVDKLDFETPPSVDWRKDGMVSPVQNQVGCLKPTRGERVSGDHDTCGFFKGYCGSCWAFSSLGALEGQMKKKTGFLVPLSPQNLVDCSTSDGNRGCRGGYISKSYNYIIRNRGVDSERFYPYERQVSVSLQRRSRLTSSTSVPEELFFSVLQKGKCRYSVLGKAGSCSSFHILPQGDEEGLKAVVARVGPVAVAVNAMLPSFHLYRGGERPRSLVRRADRRQR